uniref:Ig-like domain-containing protein n=1 Tax=Pygocentrus nattereri TaxID=42514 RepID=A0AAR2L247_PYGNA
CHCCAENGPVPKTSVYCVCLFQSSRTTRSDEERDTGWDAWGTWSDCSRTCGGGASYSLRRCLNGGNCEGRNIRYRTCSNTDCPAESGDFRAQQCSAHNDIKYQGQTYEWIPVSYDPVSPCTLRCQARGKSLAVELAPKVLDGTRCKADSLDMCINGICQEVGCDRQLGSNAKEDNCGVCAGDGSTCRLVRGQALPHTVIEVQLGSRNLRLTAKGPDMIVIEAHTPGGRREELAFTSTGSYTLANNTVDYQKGSERQTLRCHGPLSADFTIKVDTVMQFMFYQPIRYQWRETDFFPCSVTCGGGYQLNSADCVDIRYNKTVPDHHCHSYPENNKPKPKLKECNMDPCLESDGFKEVMPYDHFQPLPRWEQNPWTSCSVSCGGGSQERSVVCVEEDMQGQLVQVEEWKCTHSPRPTNKQTCNNFSCPKWVAMEWSQCTVTCGRGLRYRVVLCIDHNGQHTGGCSSSLKPHIKEDCLVPIACHKPRESIPVEAKLPWLKQAQELEETKVATEDPTFIPGPWSSCSASCGVGLQKRWVKCRVLLSFTQAEVDLPEEECSGEKPALQRACIVGPCPGAPASPQWPVESQLNPTQQGYLWEYRGFTPCTVSCGVGESDTKIINLSYLELSEWSHCSEPCGVGLQTRSVWCVRSVGGNITEPVELSECRENRPPELQACNQHHCPPTWEAEEWQQCSQACVRGTQWRKVYCRQRLAGGSFRKLPDEECDGVKPATHRPCTDTHCLQPHLDGGEWSKCSVTCGKGIQRREPVCRRLTVSGQLVTLDRSACSGLQAPPLIRSCRMKHKYAKKRCPQVLGLKRIYIQTRQEKRLSFTIGGRAYLLPKTSIVIKCPVRHFSKAQIHWEKDGQDLQNSKRLSITKSGALRIYSLEAGDIGQYSCWANQASDIFILKLIGHDNRLLEHPEGKSLGKEKNNSGSKTFLNKEGGYVSTKCQDQDELPLVKKFQKPGQSWMQKNEFYLDEGQFEELMKNISQLAESGDVTDDLASQLIGKFMEEMTAMQATSDKGATTQENTPVGKHLDRTPNSSERSGTKNLKSQAVIIRHEQHGSTMSFQRDLRINIGRTAYITNATHSLTILCSTQGVPPPAVSWTKDGLPLGDSTEQCVDVLCAEFEWRLGEWSLCSASCGNRGSQVRKTQCVGADGQETHLSSCHNRPRPVSRPQPCNLHHCPPSWVSTVWSKCSSSCGRGVQQRQVSCQRLEASGSMRVLPNSDCEGTPRPEDSEECVSDACAEWVTGSWGQCSGRCLGPAVSTQSRTVSCRHLNGSNSNSACDPKQRPASVRNCTSEMCDVHWRVLPWRRCTAACGSGFQSRKVECVHRHNNKTLPDLHCAWQRRPLTWQHCNITSCGSTSVTFNLSQSPQIQTRSKCVLL